ncbi:MAG TPA: adenylate/guanylate cyclase domain-containing protein [Candidatus Binatia bacterium]|nr:adenylate/guanylate cyclase domain-containing protein [Candidatus Binatia bacterium]
MKFLAREKDGKVDLEEHDPIATAGTGKLKLIYRSARRTARNAAARIKQLTLLRRRFVKALLVASLVALLLVSLREAGWLQDLELSAYDRLVTFFAGSQESDRVVLVVTTEADINRFGYPIRDNDLAAVLTRVFAGGPRAVGVDLYRDLPMPPGNEALQAVQRSQDNLYWVFKLPDEGNTGVPPPPALRESGREVLADHVTDAGGVVRRALLFAADERTGTNWRTMGVSLAERYTGQRLRPMDDDLALGQGRIPLLSEPYGPYARVDAAGYQMLMDFRGGHRRFRQISFAEIIDRPELAEMLRDRIVLVGTAALSIKDSFATPLSTGWGGEGSLIGIALHAHTADQLIRLANGEARNPVPLPRVVDHIAIWAAAMAGAVLALLVWRVLVALVALLLVLGVVAGATTWGFDAGVLLPGVPVALAWVLSAAACNFVMHSAGLRERAQLRRSFESYLDPRIISQMMQGETLPTFGGEHREITAVFTDIAGFTTTAETLDAATVAGLLGEYFGVLTNVVVQNGGLVNDFIGDGLVVLFGAPMDQADHADRAVAAALEMNKAGERFSAGLAARGIEWGRTRIGVHTGMALVGNIGTQGKLKYGALGDTLNTASRVEGLNKYIGSQIALTGETAAQCRRHTFRPVADIVVKGRKHVVSILAPISPDDPPVLLTRYAEAYAALSKKEPEAAELFAALHRDFPADAPAAFHAGRLAAGENGVLVVMQEK